MKNNIIWSNQNICLDDFKDFLDEEYPEVTDEAKQWELIDEQLSIQLEDERQNLNIPLPSDIICIADIGLWDGRRSGYSMMGNNLSNILRFFKDCEYASFICNAYDVIGEQSHHDGTHYLKYRMIRPSCTEVQRNHFLTKIICRRITAKDISRYTVSLRPYVAKVYGW